MILYFKIFIIWILLCCSICTNSASLDAYIESDESLVLRSYDVIQGDVVSVAGGLKKTTRCFNYLYKLKVSSSLKGKYKLDEVVDIGVNVSTFQIKKGDKHIVLIQKPSVGFINSCAFDKSLKVVDPKKLNILFGHVVSIFKINEQNNKFEVRSCKDKRDIIFEKYFLSLGFPVKVQKNIKGHSCRVLYGPLDILRDKIIFLAKEEVDT